MNYNSSFELLSLLLLASFLLISVLDRDMPWYYSRTQTGGPSVARCLQADGVTWFLFYDLLPCVYEWRRTKRSIICATFSERLLHIHRFYCITTSKSTVQKIFLLLSYRLVKRKSTRPKTEVIWCFLLRRNTFHRRCLLTFTTYTVSGEAAMTRAIKWSFGICAICIFMAIMTIIAVMRRQTFRLTFFYIWE